LRPETADYLDKARTCLADAQRIAALPLPRFAAREAYYAAFHAAEAYIFEHTGKAATTHRGVHSEFARLARREPRIDRERDLGTLEKGKLADLIVVAGDPLADVTVLQNPEHTALVLKGGETAANRLART
jgi:hypothetical protein